MANIIIDALETKELDELEHIIYQYKESINNIDEESLLTPLAVAIRTDNIDQVKLLLKYNADPNIECEMGLPLCIAVASPDRLDIVTLLLSLQDVNVNQQDNMGQTALIYACIFNNNHAVSLLTNRSDVDVHITNNTGETAIFHCMRSVELFSILYVEKHAKINISNAFGESPLQRLFDNVSGELLKSSVVEPIVDIIMDTPSEEELHLSADILASVLSCEQYLPHMFDRLVGKSNSVDYDSDTTEYGYNCKLLSVHLGLVHVLERIIEITDYNPTYDPTVALAVINEDRPASSYNMLMYLASRYDIDFSVSDQENNTVLELALKAMCIKCALWIIQHVTWDYSQQELANIAYLVLKAQDLNLVHKVIYMVNFNATILTPLNMLRDSNNQTNVILAYLGTTFEDDINMYFLSKTLPFIVANQGYPSELRNAPEWFKDTLTYHFLQQYDTLMYRSLAQVQKREDSIEVQRFRHYRKSM
ncbi:ankyrin repeat-containing protein [European chub iridovirus]|nr:ankyrin repeat-containing protein [European chub iridovirus]